MHGIFYDHIHDEIVVPVALGGRHSHGAEGEQEQCADREEECRQLSHRHFPSGLDGAP